MPISTLYFFFSIFQCNYSQIHKLNLTNRLRNNAEIQSIVNRFMALPFLPAEEILEYYNRLKEMASDNVKRTLRLFFRYFESQWLQIIRPQGFSIFGLPNRTTNAVESMDARMHRILGNHPTAWEYVGKWIQYIFFRFLQNDFNVFINYFFSGKPLRIFDESARDVTSILNGRSVSKQPRHTSCYRQVNLIRRNTLFIRMFVLFKKPYYIFLYIYSVETIQQQRTKPRRADESRHQHER